MAARAGHSNQRVLWQGEAVVAVLALRNQGRDVAAALCNEAETDAVGKEGRTCLRLRGSHRQPTSRSKADNDSNIGDAFEFVLRKYQRLDVGTTGRQFVTGPREVPGAPSLVFDNIARIVNLGKVPEEAISARAAQIPARVKVDLLSRSFDLSPANVNDK